MDFVFWIFLIWSTDTDIFVKSSFWGPVDWVGTTGNNVEIQKSSRETMQTFCECGFVRINCNKWSLHLNIYTFKPGLKTFLDKILWYILSLVCLKIAETIQKSIIYVRNLLKVVLPESGNVCWHRHLAAISSTKDIMDFRTVENCL